jgi:hypothetical protein
MIDFLNWETLLGIEFFTFLNNPNLAWRIIYWFFTPFLILKSSSLSSPYRSTVKSTWGIGSNVKGDLIGDDKQIAILS